MLLLNTHFLGESSIHMASYFLQDIINISGLCLIAILHVICSHNLCTWSKPSDHMSGFIICLVRKI